MAHQSFIKKQAQKEHRTEQRLKKMTEKADLQKRKSARVHKIATSQSSSSKFVSPPPAKKRRLSSKKGKDSAEESSGTRGPNKPDWTPKELAIMMRLALPDAAVLTDKGQSLNGEKDAAYKNMRCKLYILLFKLYTMS